jgi:DNA-binding beta-propeller fold protein YncE
MPVNRTAIALASTVLALAAGASPARAEAPPFTFDRVVLQDEKEVALKAPEGVACDDAGNFVVADSGNGRLVSYRYVAGSLSSGKEIRPAGLAYPRRIQLDSKGNLLVLDARDRKIHRIDPAGSVLGKIELRSGGTALVTLPVAFKLDAADNLYVVDAVAARVVVLDPGGTVIRQLELPKGTSAVTDVHVDSAGTVYVIDGAQAAIWSAEKGATAFKPFTPSMRDRMNFPVYLTGSRGRFYVVDQNGNGIVVLGADGSFQGRQLAIGWGDGFLYYPAQMCMNASGDVFIADRGNNRVQIFNTSR